MPAARVTMQLENILNTNDRNQTVDVPVSKNKRFLARKIHKLKKILKMSSNLFRKHNSVAAADLSLEEWQNHQNSIEEQMQNYENELLEKKLAAKHYIKGSNTSTFEHDQNVANENWENWDSCYLCAQAHTQSAFSAASAPPPPYSPTANTDSNSNSICYVFMPGQVEPVPVKLRNAKIPGGVMWIVYRPDLDLCYRDNLYEITSNQIAQAQRPILV
ncbi:uncharacterized protein LOC135844590 [Planococcus citri]|uniref:uncharacterized protein LOC135844590 n=1 Tax=Planococcus citri TaxID=170843 RepID=UPI0031F80F6B